MAPGCCVHNRWMKPRSICRARLFASWAPTESLLTKLLTSLPLSNSKGSVQFSSVTELNMSNSLWPHGLQHACLSPTPGVYSNSCPLSQWCHPTISSSVVPFSCFQSFPASGSFQWVGSSHQVAKELELQHQSFQWIFRTISFRMDWLDLHAVQGTLKNLFQHHSSKASILQHSVFFIVQLSHPYMPTEKTIALTRQTFVGKVMSLLFNMLSRFQEQPSFNFMASVTICSDFGTPQNKICHCFHHFPIYLPWSDGMGCHDLSFLNVEF